MTVIAWDGTTLAADRRANAGFNYEVTKIMRMGDALVGISGHLGYGLAVVAWIEAGANRASFPEWKRENEEAFVMVIHRDGRVERYEGGAYPICVESSFHCIGSGRDFALAAMYLGYDARRAVEVAIALNSDCGDGIDVLTFEPTP